MSGAAARPGSVQILGIGTLFSGRLAAPVHDADSLLVEDGRITAVGGGPWDAQLTIDAAGVTVAPGLIDSHCHVVLGDYTPRQRAVGFLESYVHGGITTVVSPGEIHLPGRPHDRSGVKALAIVAQRAWAAHRPGGMKVHGGSVVLEPSLTAEDFRELAAEGVRLAKFGFGLYDDPADGVPQVRDAQAAGIVVTCHSGGASIPGSAPITAEHLLLLRPDVCGHVNGGPTSLDDDGVRAVVRDTDMVLQLVQAGCLRSSLLVLDEVDRAGAWDRVVLGSDTPTGTGVMPLAMLKTIAELCSLAGADPAAVWACATGVAAGVYGLDTGVVEVGRPADLCVIDAPWGSRAADAAGALRRGDLPGVAAVLADGELRVLGSRNSPAAARPVVVDPPVGRLPGADHVT